MVEGYELLRRISEGVASELHLARRTKTSEHVVLEVMRPEVLSRPALRSRFLARARACLGLVHPSIARRVRVGFLPDGRHWLVTEPVGQSLASRLAARGALSPEALLPLALQLCDALDFLHQRGLVHGNLKPASVYVLEGEGQGRPTRVKLVDFGLSLLREKRGPLKRPGVILVEPEYLAPERVGGQRATPASDLYAAGVLFYELLTGFPPFCGADSGVVRRRQVSEPPEPLPARCARLRPVVERCLAKDPAARYPSAAALKAALQECSAEETGSGPEVVEVDLGLEAAPPPALPAAATPPAMPALPTLGSWKLEVPLGKGAMGWVFLAQHQTVGRRAALKVLRPELARCHAEVARFVQEARAVNRIRHEHIVEVYDCVDETLPGGERRVYLVMELLEGLSLGQAVRRGPLPLPRTLRVMRQVALALDAVHRVGVVHRDVKPDNIFLSARAGADFVKVLDFGVAKLREQGADMVDGKPVVVGTPQYMAPEQLLGRPTDHRADVFALGIVLYQLVAGRPPFAGNMEQVVKGIVGEAPAALPAKTAHGESVPEALSSLIAACLEKDPERRPQTMAEVGTALEELLAAAALPPPARAPTSRPRRRLARLALPALGLALAAGFAALALLGRDPSVAADPSASTAAPREVSQATAQVESRASLAQVETPDPAEPSDPAPLSRAKAHGVAAAALLDQVAPGPGGLRLAKARAREQVRPKPVLSEASVPATKVEAQDERGRRRPATRSGRGMGRDDVIDPFAP